MKSAKDVTVKATSTYVNWNQNEIAFSKRDYFLEQIGSNQDVLFMEKN